MAEDGKLVMAIKFAGTPFTISLDRSMQHGDTLVLDGCGFAQEVLLDVLEKGDDWRGPFWFRRPSSRPDVMEITTTEPKP